LRSVEPHGRNKVQSWNEQRHQHESSDRAQLKATAR
jgi:hypothetical protein